MEKFFKSILEQDKAPIVVCDIHTVINVIKKFLCPLIFFVICDIIT